MKRKFMKIFLGCAVLSALFVSAGCGKKSEAELNPAQEANNGNSTEGILISTVKAKISGIEDKIKLVGTVFPSEQINVYSRASGKLSKYLVEEGSIVKQDDIVAYIDRDEPGFEFSPSPVKTPAAGIILKKYLDSGASVTSAAQSVSMATPIALLGEIRKVKVQVNIVEEDIGRVKKDQDAVVKIEAYDKEFKGKVNNISPSADALSHTVKVEILLDNSEGLIKPGVTAEVDMIVGRHNNSVVIPREALLRKLDETFVYVIKNNIVEKRIVKPGYDDSERLEVISGLKPGEIIAMSDFNILQSGLKVKIQK